MILVSFNKNAVSYESLSFSVLIFEIIVLNNIYCILSVSSI